MELFEQYTDEHGNIHVRVSQEVCVLTKEEEAAAIAKFEALKAENAKLRSMRDTWQENDAKLRELVRDMWRDGMCECDERGACTECEYHFPDRIRELGIEVS